MKKVKQISTKTLGYSAKEIRALVEDKGEAVFLARIGGVSVDCFTREGKNGSFTGFRGSFIAVNNKNDQFEASTAYFPGQVTQKLAEAFEKGVVELEITVDVYAIETDKNASGYAYLCEPVMKAEQEEKIVRMKNALFSNLPTLAIEDKTKKGGNKK